MFLDLQSLVGQGYGDYWRSKCRYCVVKGSRASKKSKTTALWIIANLIDPKKSQANALIVRRNFNTLKDSCYSDLKWAIDKLNVDKFFRCTTNPLEITYIPTGQKILFRGLDDGLKITSISVPKGVLCWVWIEEAYEITNENDFNKLDLSIRGQIPNNLNKRFMITFNGWSANTWLKRRFFDVENKNTLAITTTWRCNEWLDNADRSLFEDMKKTNYRRWLIESEGEWGISEGLIYERHEYKDFDVQALREDKNIISAFGLDFGFTDPNAFVCCLIDNTNKIIYVFDEWYQRGVTNEKIAEQIKLKGYASEKIICDSAEPKSIQELYNLGIRAEPSRKGADSVNHGIQRIQNYKIIVHTRCIEFYKEISNYTWAKDRNNNPTDKPDHEFSHGMDAMRYAVNKVINGARFSYE
jgi:phage terminase large subunit